MCDNAVVHDRKVLLVRFQNKRRTLTAILLIATVAASTNAVADENNQPSSMADCAPGAVVLDEQGLPVEGAETAECLPMKGVPGFDGEVDALIQPYMDKVYSITRGRDEFIDVGMDLIQKRIVLYWKGDLPVEIQTIAGELAKVGVSLEHHELGYGLSESYDLENRLLVALTDAGIHVGTLTTDVANGGFAMSGREVSVDSDAQARAQVIASAVLGEFPLSFRDYRGPLVNASGSRYADTSPHYSGAKVRGVLPTSYADCSSSAQLKELAGSVTHRYIMTAAHCTDYHNGVDFRNGNTTVVLGSTTWTAHLYGNNGAQPGPAPLGGPRLDVSLIRLSTTGVGSNRIYVGGPITSSSTAVNQVDPWPLSLPGSTAPLPLPVCTTGQATGWHCNATRWEETGLAEGCLIPVAPGSTCSAGNVRYTRGGFAFKTGSRIPLAGSGDSGGSIFRNMPDGSRRLVGSISAVPAAPEFVVTCESDAVAGTVCSDWVFFTPMNQVETQLASTNVDFVLS